MKTKNFVTDEKILADKAYAAYLSGRLAGCLPEASAPSLALLHSYLTPDRQPVELYAFARGITSPDPKVLSRAQLLDAVHAEVSPPAPPRRPRRPDARWGVRS